MDKIEELFVKIGIPKEDSATYAVNCVNQKITFETLVKLTREDLKELKIRIWHRVLIEDHFRSEVILRKNKARYSGIKNSFETVLEASETWFVDKTMLIATVAKLLLPSSTSSKLEQRDPLMITAPSKFGKTTNLEMLLCFFSGIVSRETFEKLKIGKTSAMQWWGQLNPIYVAFGNFSDSITIRSEEDCWKACRSIVHTAFKNFDHIVDHLSKSKVSAFKKWLDEDLYLNKTIQEVGNGLRFLVQCVHEYDRERHVLLLIDEFDRIYTSACWFTTSEELKHIIRFCCDLVGQVVKHKALCVAVLSGVTAVHLSDSLNNVNWRRFLEEENFSTFYGITEKEFSDVMKRPKISAKVRASSAEALQWYNGYEAFGTKILNPFSVRKFIEKEKIAPYWRESSSADSLDRNIFRPKEIRNTIIDLIHDRATTIYYLKPMLKATDFDSLENETQKLLRTDVILNLLLQQGYITIIGERRCTTVKIKAPNIEVKEELNELLRQYYVEICRFDPEKMGECRDCFSNMDMEKKTSCEENLKRIKTILNELFSAVDLSEIDEFWFKSFLFQLFFQNFRIQEQEKVPGTSVKNDRRFWKQLDMCISAEDRWFVFEFTKTHSAKKALNKISKKKYFNAALHSKSRYLLIGIAVGKVEETIDVSINYLFNTTLGKGTMI
ncbi:uncharacterized protein in vnfD 5'region-like [Planococcus citri]|uniref:uncharacterized protein in vnfD 5'region-like n=1 Tax=Planococcus citri TaxID=170843 RepID=UPI0031F900FF